ncbi:hypothetical protein SESBI_25732 [Sesbania bispinosa]|nr:hypothetical protein SESBI_25732 [Sesbania bispinosa]
MGNCCKPAASSMEWGGDDWGSLASDHEKKNTRSNKVFDVEGHGLRNLPKEKLLGTPGTSSDVHGTVKIKVSKKELAELLGGIEKQQQQKKQGKGRASAEQVLLRLINARDHANQLHHHHGPWKPVLETIPEVD